jgi:Zn-dependent protease
MGFLDKRWQVGRIAGFPIEVNLTFLLLLGLVFLTRGGLVGVLLTALTFVSVLVHELGHAVVARRRGVRIGGIELQFFGGVAKMITPPRSARDEMAIAAAGPAVSLALATVGLAAGAWLDSALLRYFGLTNLVLGVFNLLPALPMDGGRLYRAFLARRRGVLAATASAVQLSKWIAIGLGVLGLLGGQLFVAVLALMIYLMSRAEARGAWALHYHDVPADPIDVDVLGAGGRGIDPFGPDEAQRFSGRPFAPQDPRREHRIWVYRR